MSERRRVKPGDLSGLVFEFSDTAFGQKIHRCGQRDHDQRGWRGDEGRGDGRDIDENGDEVFACHPLVQTVELGFVMVTSYRRAQEKKRNGAGS